MKKTISAVSVFLAALMLFSLCAQAGILGDFTGDGKVTSDDAVYLLRYTLFQTQYPINGEADFTGDGNITSDDAVYLLRYTLFPTQYPIDADPYFVFRKAGEEEGPGYYIMAKSGVTLQKDLVIPSEHNGLPVIGVYAGGFQDHGEIVSLTIPSSVYYLDSDCFAGCTGLKSVTIAEGKRDLYIDGCAFEGDVSLVTVELPSNLYMILFDAFKDCTGLKTIRYKGCKGVWDILHKYSSWDKGAGDYELIFDPAPADDSLFVFTENKDGTYGIACAAEDTELPRQLILPSKHNGKQVTCINKYAFYNHTEIRYLVIPEPYIYIRKGAFCYCDGLFYVSLPASLQMIDYISFANCQKIEIFDYDGTVEDWDAMETAPDWHYTSTSNAEYVINYRPTEDKYFSFRLLNSEDQGYYYVIGAKDVDDLPASIALPSEHEGYPVTCVNNEGFRFAKGIKKLIIPEGYTEIGENAFEGCSALEYVDLPETLLFIDGNSFYGCDSLKEIELPKELYSIGSYAFSYSGLTHIDIPRGTRLIGTGAFMFCYSLTDVFLGENVRILHDNAFEECTSLTTVTILNRDIEYIGVRAFALCSSLIAVNYNGTRDDWAKINVQKSWTYNAGGYVILYRGDCDAYIYSYSGGVEVKNKSALPETLIIPTIIDGFRVTNINSRAFKDCTGIKKLVIPYGIEYILDDAFKGCTGLTSVILPGSMYWVGSSSFEGCTGLKTLITSPGDRMIIREKAFKNCDLRTVYLASGLIEVHDEAFAGNADLGELTLPDGVDYIGTNFIKDCTSLYSLTIPKTVSCLRASTVNGNPSLSFITFTGKVDEWEELDKDTKWCAEDRTITIGCTDGYVSSNGKPLG